MNPAKNRERKCSTCKHYQPSPLWRKGWCRNPLLYDRNTNHLVEADSLACNRTFIDYWEPMVGPAPQAGPQARTAKPRIAPSIPMDTVDAQGNRTTVTGGNNTPAAGMAALAPKPKPRPNDIPSKPALSLVTPDFDEVFGEDELSTTAPIEPVGRSGRSRGATGSQAVKTTKVLPTTGTGPAALWGNTRTQIILIAGIVVVLLAAVGGTFLLTRNNGNKGVATASPTNTAVAQAQVQPTPTGFGDPTMTVPAGAATTPQAPAAPPNTIAVNGWVQVQGTGSGLVVRDSPAKTGKRLIAMPDGTKVHVVDGPTTADGYTWWKVEGYDTKNPSAAGWCVAQYLIPATAP